VRKTPFTLYPFVLLMLFLLLSGCTSLALYATGSLVPNLTRAFFEECDLELARQSLPAQLKLMEGLLNNAPQNREFLTALCMGFTGYAMVFVEEEDPDRASSLYQRARAYGLRAIGMGDAATHQAIQGRLKTVGREEIEPLFWMTMSWNAWINLNLDKPAALGQLSTAQACLDRVMEIDPDYFYGSPYILSGSILAARPKMLGGDEAAAKSCLSKAMSASDGAFFLAPYYYARYYAVRVQDKALFFELIQGVEQGRPDRLREVCLINTAIQRKMKGLRAMADGLFF
jgi:tetratricopeptide (TPR) repeat protein